MPVFKGATGGGTGITDTPADPLTFSHDAGTGGENYTTLVAFCWIDADATVSAVTYAGEAMTLVASGVVTLMAYAVYKKQRSATGSNTVSIDLSSGTAISAVAYSANDAREGLLAVTAEGTDVSALGTAPSGFTFKVSFCFTEEDKSTADPNFDPDTGTEDWTEDTSEATEEVAVVTVDQKVPSAGQIITCIIS